MSGRSMRGALFFESTVIVGAIVALAVITHAGPKNEHAMLHITLVLVGVVVAGTLNAILWRRTLERETLVRRFFVSPHWIYNHEIGYAPLDNIAPDDDVYGFVTFAAEALARMSYGFEVANPPESFEPIVLIDSRVFLYHAASDDPDDGIVIDEWRGMVRHVTGTDLSDESNFEDIAAFDDAGELARLLEDFLIDQRQAPELQGDVA